MDYRGYASIICLAALTGCSAYEARAPKPFAPRVEQKDGITITESTFESADGWVHYERSWKPATAPTNVLVIVHGLKDHSKNYSDFAMGLAQKGTYVASYDHRGHGLSDGKSQRVDGFNDFITDLDSFIGRTQAQAPRLPTFLFGHSMGGAIATTYALDHQPQLAGLILSAPALSTSASGGEKFGAHVAAALFPGAGAAPLDLNKFTRNQTVLQAALNDPLVDKADVPAVTIAGLLDTMERIERDRSSLSIPLLAVHGEADQITEPPGTMAFAEHVSSKDKAVWLCPSLVHDLLHEPEGAAIAAGIQHWIAMRTPQSPNDGADNAKPDATPAVPSVCRAALPASKSSPSL